MGITRAQADLIVAFATNATGEININGVRISRWAEDSIRIKSGDVETWVVHPIITLVDSSAVWIQSRKFGVQIRIPIEEVEIC